MTLDNQKTDSSKELTSPVMAQLCPPSNRLTLCVSGVAICALRQTYESIKQQTEKKVIFPLLFYNRKEQQQQQQQQRPVTALLLPIEPS